MTLKNLSLALVLAASLAACAMPTTTTNSVTHRPTLGISNAPDSAVVRLDGAVLGNAADMNGVTNVVRIEEGLHKVEVLVGNVVVHQEQVYVSGGERKIIDAGMGSSR